MHVSLAREICLEPVLLDVVVGGAPQLVDGVLHLAPGAIRRIERDSLAPLSFAPDFLADLLKLLGEPLICGRDCVYGFSDLASQAVVVTRQANREIAAPNSLQGKQ